MKSLKQKYLVIKFYHFVTLFARTFFLVPCMILYRNDQGEKKSCQRCKWKGLFLVFFFIYPLQDLNPCDIFRRWLNWQSQYTNSGEKTSQEFRTQDYDRTLFPWFHFFPKRLLGQFPKIFFLVFFLRFFFHVFFPQILFTRDFLI